MLCNKCKVSQPYQEDTWCLACSAVESLSSELKTRWEFPGLREAAEECIIGAARQVRSLKRLSLGLAAERAAAKSKEPARRAEAALNTPAPRSPLPRSKSRTPRGEAVKAEEEEKQPLESPEVEEGESYSEEEGNTLPGAARLPARPVVERTEAEADEGRSRGSQRPPEPEEPPASSDRRRRSEREGRRDGAHHKRRRGGAKHKRLARLVDDPTVRVHRSFGHQNSDSHSRRKTW